MSTHVIAYADPKRLQDNPEFQVRRDWVHICATTTLAKGMRRRYGASHQSAGGRGINFISVREVIDQLLTEWMSDAVRLRQYAHLTRFIEGMRQEHPEWTATLRAYRRNQREVLLAIRVLAEANLFPTALKPQTTEEVVFQRLWTKMEQQDKILQQVRLDLHQRMPGDRRFPGVLQRAVNKALVEAYTRAHQSVPNPDWTPNAQGLVLHGFYFITPLQLQIFRLCEHAGIDVAYMNYYDSRLPKVFSTWEAFFTPQNGLPGREEWIMPHTYPELPPLGKILGAILSGEEPPEHDRVAGTCIWRFEDFGQFLNLFMPERTHQQTAGERTDSANNGARDAEVSQAASYYSPEAKRLNRFLREHFPEDVEHQQRHFLAYPVGQLLFHLHKMWDEQTQQLGITDHALYECFASGWLQEGALNGRHYLRALHDLLPFFSGCSNLTEWRERAQLLREVHEHAVRSFDLPMAKEQRNWRFHRYLGSPLERLAHFRVDQQALDAIMVLMERLFTIAERLFTHDEVGLSEHFRRIEELLLEHANTAELLEEERELLHGLRERMARGASDEDRYLPQDLAEAITLYLGGDLSETEEQQDTAEEELIGSFVGLDGAFLHPDVHRLHLCLLGEKSLPKHKPAFPWPLSQQTFAHMSDHIAIRMLALREMQSKHADRYLFFSAVTWADEVTLSWIVRWHDEELGPSPYLMLLEPYCRTAQAGLQRWSAGRQAYHTEVAETIPSRPDAYEAFPQDALAELALCPRRFYYSFLTQESPSYSSDFHHQFLYGSLVKAFARASERSEDEAAAEMSKLFPQWTGLQCQDFLERAPQPSGGRDRYDGADYPKSRYRAELLHLSKREGHGPAKSVLAHLDKQDAALKGLASMMAQGGPRLPAQPSHACRYCPHIDYCDAAHYAVDDSEESPDDAE